MMQRKGGMQLSAKSEICKFSPMTELVVGQKQLTCGQNLRTGGQNEVYYLIPCKKYCNDKKREREIKYCQNDVFLDITITIIPF